MRQRRPQTVIEIGCGHSTRVIRQANTDCGFACRLSCIDPSRGRILFGLPDEFINGPIEDQDAEALAERLEPNDVLFFIDTSHEARVAKLDVAFIYCCLLPRLKSGVVVHIHDVFLPWDYTEHVVFDRSLSDWVKQYVVHALVDGGGWTVLWPVICSRRSLISHHGSRKTRATFRRRACGLCDVSRRCRADCRAFLATNAVPGGNRNPPQ